MKSKILISVLIVIYTIGSSVKSTAQSTLDGEISISGAFALYPMVIRWAEEFKKIHPKVRIDVSAGGAGKGITDALGGMIDLGMVSREVYPEETKRGAYSITVTKDAVVPVISAANPSLNELLAIGLKRGTGSELWITGKFKGWSQAFGIKSKLPIHVYTRSDASGAAEMWAKYFGAKQEDLLGVGVYGDPGLAQAINKDALGIGFNNMGYIYDSKTKKQISGIRVLPLDLNNNGKIDPDENFYNTLDELVAAIATGKYPSPPTRELYLVSKGKPKKKIVSEFIRWILTDGQKYVNESGYIALSKEKITQELEKVK